MKTKQIITLISSFTLILSLSGCNKTSNYVKSFEDNISDNNFASAYSTYEENKGNVDFAKEADKLLDTISNELKNNINEDTLSRDKEFLDLITKIKGEDAGADISNKITEFEESKSIYDNAVKYLNENNYYLAISEFEKIKEGSEYHTKATMGIEDNLDKARLEKIEAAKSMYENNNFEGAIKALNDTKTLIDNDTEIDNLIQQYTSEKEKYIKDSLNKSTENTQNENSNTDVKYNKYQNARYQFSIDYPSNLLAEPDPANGDGRIFNSPDGTVHLSATGYNNVFNETAEANYNKAINTSKEISYKVLNDNSYAISFEKDGDIFYSYWVFGTNSVNYFVFSYPKSEASIYNGIVTRIYESFTPGNLSKSH